MSSSPIYFYFVDVMQNSTLEERVTVLEIQVTDIREDIATVEQDVADLDQDVNFLFDQQIIQDERLFQLETETEGIEEEVEGLFFFSTAAFQRFLFNVSFFKYFHFINSNKCQKYSMT